MTFSTSIPKTICNKFGEILNKKIAFCSNWINRKIPVPVVIKELKAASITSLNELKVSLRWEWDSFNVVQSNKLKKFKFLSNNRKFYNTYHESYRENAYLLGIN